MPRWRSSALAATTPEARSNRIGTAPNMEVALRLAEAEFRANASVPIASELMFAASQAGENGLAREAATLIASKQQQIASKSLLSIANAILSPPAGLRNDLEPEEFVRTARRSLHQNFNNPILLIDVAHALTARGQPKAAERYVKGALHFAPLNRFILRSAVRYFLHVGEKEYAHHLLLRSPLLKGDPWIQASEIAVASVLGKTSKLVKGIDKILQDEPVLAFNFSELGSAIATVHLNSGGDKKAKKLFTKSLVHPNDNTVAQAEWASRKLGLVVTESALLVPLSFEANSGHSYRSLDIETAIAKAKDWASDEPYASRPVGWLGYLHSIYGDYEKAAEYHQQVFELESKPTIADLLNLNFCRIETGATVEANETLLELSRDPDIASHKSHFLANAGALAYAIGDHKSGAELYQKAIASTKAASDTRTEALVRAFFARAAVKYGDPGRDEILEVATKASLQLANPGATYVLAQLSNEATRKKLEASAQSKIAKHQIDWDQLSNTLTLR